MDWVTYVVQLDPSEAGTADGLLKKTASNRSTFKSEDNVVGMIYVPAKSTWRYLDVSSVISDAIMGAAFGKTLGERVHHPILGWSRVHRAIIQRSIWNKSTIRNKERSSRASIRDLKR